MMKMKKAWILMALGATFCLVLIIGIRQYTTTNALTYADETVSKSIPDSEIKKEKKDRDHGLKRVNAEASYIGFEDIDALENDADVIVVGTPILPFEKREHEATYYEDGFIQNFYTLTDFKVEKVIKDPEQAVQNEKIKFIEPISIVTNENGQKVIYSIADYQEVQQGEKYLVFLKNNGLGNYSVINMNNGTFDLNENEENSFNALEIEGDPVHEKLKNEALEEYDLN
ncbi:hypothetical protein [Saccharibacillus qingshengii]|uniref:hypothetical protein n=1 Tax=Saccharibacillus qingshengii TaxID=1763540 RepID=UPI001553B20B|nr:hypothetical protein [Saccharibacillus qingshengii]